MKGVSGKIIATIVTLILAVLAVVIVWEIYRGVIFGTVADAITRISEGFAKSICEKIPLLKHLC